MTENDSMSSRKRRRSYPRSQEKERIKKYAKSRCRADFAGGGGSSSSLAQGFTEKVYRSQDAKRQRRKAINNEALRSKDDKKQNDNSLASMHLDVCASKIGFTLAEVLITLGIIGVVAALTLPTLIQNYKKQQTVVQLKKFYSTINQALKLAEVEHGDANGWDVTTARDPDAMLNTWNKYLSKHFVSNDITKTADGIFLKMSDGSGLMAYSTALENTQGFNEIHMVFCLKAKACQESLDNNSNKVINSSHDGKNMFLFHYYGNGIRTYYDEEHDGLKNRDVLLSGSKYYYSCGDKHRFYCAALIEFDGWEISPDYPVKF